MTIANTQLEQKKAILKKASAVVCQEKHSVDIKKYTDYYTFKTITIQAKGKTLRHVLRIKTHHFGSTLPKYEKQTKAILKKYFVVLNMLLGLKDGLDGDQIDYIVDTLVLEYKNLRYAELGYFFNLILKGEYKIYGKIGVQDILSWLADFWDLRLEEFAKISQEQNAQYKEYKPDPDFFKKLYAKSNQAEKIKTKRQVLAETNKNLLNKEAFNQTPKKVEIADH